METGPRWEQSMADLRRTGEMWQPSRRSSSGCLHTSPPGHACIWWGAHCHGLGVSPSNQSLPHLHDFSSFCNATYHSFSMPKKMKFSERFSARQYITTVWDFFRNPLDSPKAFILDKHSQADKSNFLMVELSNYRFRFPIIVRGDISGLSPRHG